MKVAEKSNGALHSSEERREETVSLNQKSPNQQKGKGEEKPKDEQPPAAEKPEVKVDTEKQNEGSEAKPTTVLKPVPNLESTLKVVEDLHRRSKQRDNLLLRIKQLEAFEIAQIEEADELEGNHFQSCQLIIADPKGRKFITETSGLIKLVSEFIHKSCLEKLAEIEANIVFPRF